MKNKWQDDLAYDIRTHTDYDYVDYMSGHDPRIPRPEGYIWPPAEEMSQANRDYILDRFLRVKNNCRAILEIGVNRELNPKSSTSVFIENKLDSTLYIGVDFDDKSYLDSPAKNIFTIREESEKFLQNFDTIKKLGVQEFDFIFIDGNHSIHNVLLDWEYTALLSPIGIVGFHDTSQHPGPHFFLKALDRNKWVVEENLCPYDNGIGFCWKKL